MCRPMLELRGGGLDPLVQALPQTSIIRLRSALAIRPPENFQIIRPLQSAGGRPVRPTTVHHHPGPAAPDQNVQRVPSFADHLQI